jgi:3-dehydroquinate synthase
MIIGNPGLRTVETTRVTVNGAKPYDVVIGRDLLGELPAMLGSQTLRVLVVVPEPLAALGEAVRASLAEHGYEPHMIRVPDAEGQKTSTVLAQCWGVLGRAGFTRSDAIVGVGGGATTDLAGFVAASWMRGVRWVAVATTLAGMVDAAVGGKTGINTHEGKNLVGAFWAPDGVICDLAALETLAPRDVRAGLAEVVKTGFIADPEILRIIQANADGLRDWAGHQASAQTWEAMAELVRRSVQVKAAVVGEDLTAQGLREILNSGHTFGHAVELHEDYRWRHGEAVSVGMIFVAELAQAAGLLDAGVVAQHRAILESLALPTGYEPGRWDALLAAMRRDKKARGNLLRFVVLRDVGLVERLEGPSEALLEQAYTRITGG